MPIEQDYIADYTSADFYKSVSEANDDNSDRYSISHDIKFALRYKYIKAYTKVDKQELNSLAEIGDEITEPTVLYLKKLAQEILKTYAEIDLAVEIAYKEKNEQWMFELEQVMGHVNILAATLINMKRSTENRDYIYTFYSKEIDDINKSMTAINQLGTHFLTTTPDIVWRRNLGILLFGVGALACVSFILLASVPSFGGAFAIALASASMLGASTSIGTALGMSAAAAGPGGIAAVGAAVSALFAGIGAHLALKSGDRLNFTRKMGTLTQAIGKMKPTAYETINTDLTLRRDILKTLDKILKTPPFNIENNVRFKQVVEKHLKQFPKNFTNQTLEGLKRFLTPPTEVKSHQQQWFDLG